MSYIYITSSNDDVTHWWCLPAFPPITHYSQLRTYHEVIDEIYNKVTNVGKERRATVSLHESPLCAATTLKVLIFAYPPFSLPIDRALGDRYSKTSFHSILPTVQILHLALDQETDHWTSESHGR